MRIVENIKNEKIEDVLEFKSRKKQFQLWLDEVKETNFTGEQEGSVDSAFLIWDKSFEDGTSQLYNAWYNCPVKELERMYKYLGEFLLEKKMEDFMMRRIGDFIKYID